MLQVPALFEVLHVGVRPELRERLAHIDLENYEGVAYKVEEALAEVGVQVSSSYLVSGIFALKQYYAIALLDPANAHAISRSLDPFWHMHILHTEAYTAFCGRVMGEYMHHLPLDRRNPAHIASIRTLYNYTLEVLRKVFSLINPNFWPTTASDNDLICMHKGNQTIYSEVQPYRLFEPDSRAVGYA